MTLNIEKPQYKIYRDGQYQVLESWKPAIKQNLINAIAAFDNWTGASAKHK